MKILVFEAVTGGGQFLDARAVASGGLLAEGLTMLAGLCCDLLDRSPQQAGNLAKCLLRTAGLPNPGLPNPGRRTAEPAQVTLLWDGRIPRHRWHEALLRAQHKSADLAQPAEPITLRCTQFSDTSGCQTQDSVYRGPRRWTLAENLLVPGDRSAIRNPHTATGSTEGIVGSTEVSFQAQAQVREVNSLGQTVAVLQAAVKQVDAVLLVAPEPTLSYWYDVIAKSSGNGQKIVSMPASHLRRCEHKLTSTTMPSWQYPWPETHTPNHRVQQSVISPLDRADISLKPIDGCGSADVWRVAWQRSPSSLEELGCWLAELRSRLPIETPSQQTLLINPWVDGTPLSVSLIAGPTGLVLLPPTQQLLRWDRLVLPPELRAPVSRVEKVSYWGSELFLETEPMAVSDIHHRLRWQLEKLFSPPELRQWRGWVGIDCVWTPQHELEIIEINPRLTSSYNLLRWHRGIGF